MASQPEIRSPVELQKHLKGVDYPARKQDLINAAQENGAPQAAWLDEFANSHLCRGCGTRHDENGVSSGRLALGDRWRARGRGMRRSGPTIRPGSYHGDFSPPSWIEGDREP